MAGNQSPMMWREEFLLGIEPLDRQHKRIFECMLAIENAVEKRDPWHVVEWLVADLDSTIALHLAAEETLLDVLSYPRFESHRAQHGQLRAGITELKQTLKQSMKPEALIPYFEQWFIFHVLSHDRDYAEFLKPIIGRVTAI